MPTFLLTNEVIQTSLWKMLESNPSYSQDITTKAKVGKSAVCTYFCFIPGVTNNTAGDFPSISQAKTGWRTDGTLSGYIQSGTWTFKVAIYNDTKYGFSIKVAVRISKSANADGSNATLIQLSESPNVKALPATAGAIVTDSWTWSAPQIDFSNEYLFVEYRLHIEVAAGNSSAQCSFICDEDPSVREESVTTPTYVYVPPMPPAKWTATVDKQQRPCSFYSQGRHWVFYYNNGNLCFKTSTDGSTWSSETVVTSCYHENSYWADFHVFYDGTYVHYAVFKPDYKLYYRRGTPNSDGTITWHADEQLVYEGSSSVIYRPDSMCKDSNGYVWIGATKQETNSERAYVFKNNRTDQYWENPSGFPYVPNDSVRNWLPKVLALTGGKVYVLYAKYAGATYYDLAGKLWTGSWGSEESGIAGQYLYGFDWYDAVADGDNVHVVYGAYSNDYLRHRIRVYGTGWGDETTVDSRQYPTLTYVKSGTWVAIYCFWCRTDTDYVYFKKYSDGVWDASATIFSVETEDGITAQTDIRAYVRNYGSYFGVSYILNTINPSYFYVKYGYILITRGVASTDTVHAPWSFYANGRFWLFYYNNGTIYFRSAVVGQAFSSPTLVTQAFKGQAQLPCFHVFCDGTYVHYAVFKSDYKLYYRRGTPNSDGTITWHADEQLVYTYTDGEEARPTHMCKDSNGYVWIATSNYYALGYDTYAFKNNRTDQYWENPSGFPYLLGTAYSNCDTKILALTGGKVYAIYVIASDKFLAKPAGKLYDNGWGSQETEWFIGSMYSGLVMDAVAEGDNVHFVGVYYTDAKIYHYKRTYGVGWSTTPVEVASTQSNETVPRLAYHPSVMFCFWSRLDNDTIYYKDYVNGNWATQPSVLAEETEDGLPSFYSLRPFERNYDSYIGIQYLIRLASPYAIIFMHTTIVEVVKYIQSMDFPMSFLPKPVTAGELRSKVEGATITVVSKDFPMVVKEKNKQAELVSKFE